MSRVAVAASNHLAATAGVEVAASGGTAADAAVAAALVSTATEPGVCSPFGGAWMTISDPRGTVVLDANVEAPGRGLPPDAFGDGWWAYESPYAGGMRTAIGHGTVATPGTLKGLALVHERWGRLPWREVVAPAIEAARDGFPLGASNHHYLAFVHDDLYGWHPPSRAVLHDDEGRLLDAGATVRIPALADTLEAIADEGVDLLHRGELGAIVVDDVARHGGILTRADLAAYEVHEHRPATVRAGEWTVAVPPPPSIGGSTLAAMLLLLGDRPSGAWTREDTRHLAAVQAAVLRRRLEGLDGAEDLLAAARRLLDDARAGDVEAFRESPSTIHLSVVDDAGLAVALTASSGYGSGAMPPGTGLWLNNCLGELELNHRGVHGMAPGTRLPSNMAPTVARRPQAALAIGSPGADRITTALVQVLAGHLNGGLPLDVAIAHPRLHVAFADDDPDRPRRTVVRYEEDLPLPELGVDTLSFPPHAMSFGGVGAALVRDGLLTAAADPRRDGATATSR